MRDPQEAPWERNERRSRRRAILVLSGLAVVAVLLLGLMAAFYEADAGKPSAGPSVVFSQSPSASRTASAAPSSSAPPQQPAPPPTTAPPSTSPAGPPCQANPCAVPGDAGNAVGAVNSFRQARGAAPVAGAATAQAAQCALDQGGGSACQPHYAWETLPAQDGQQCVQQIGGRDPGWLLDPDMQSFSVGWAYAPGQNQWYCALLKSG